MGNVQHGGMGMGIVVTTKAGIGSVGYGKGGMRKFNMRKVGTGKDLAPFGHLGSGYYISTTLLTRLTNIQFTATHKNADMEICGLTHIQTFLYTLRKQYVK